MCNLDSNGDTTIKRWNLGCVFLGESKTGFVISDHMDSSLPKKRKSDPKIRKRFIYHDNGMSSCSSWEKNNKLILAAKTRRKSNINYVWICEMYIFRLKHSFSRTEYTLGKLNSKNLKLKPMNFSFFFFVLFLFLFCFLLFGKETGVIDTTYVQNI